MLRLFRNKRWWLLLVVMSVLAFAMSFTAKNNDLFNRFSLPVITAISPVQKVLSTASLTIKEGLGTIPEIFALKKQNEELLKQVRELEQYKQRFLEYQRENINLRSMLGLKQRNFQYELEAAEVIGRDPGNWFNVILIDKGENNGIKKDMAVITDQGLVGYTISVGKNYAKVLLITDDRSSVSAMIERTRDNGILKGTIDPAPRGYVKMVFLPQEANIVKGDIVISSGLGGIVPKGIVIGEVVEAKKEPYDLMQYAIVKPEVDLQKLEQVFVIKSQNGNQGGSNP
ncbi:MAG TPA: rod shape-determining protein MreC [Thermoanaerobacterales bacterium]|nr:rod shape-determining protein MreC [Thermoanaerobacterales bacterium]